MKTEGETGGWRNWRICETSLKKAAAKKARQLREAWRRKKSVAKYSAAESARLSVFYRRIQY